MPQPPSSFPVNGTVPASAGFELYGYRIVDHAKSEQERGTCEEDRSSAKRSYTCNWDERSEVLRALIGFPDDHAFDANNNILAAGSLGYVTRYIPHSLPDWHIDAAVVTNGILPRVLTGTIPYLYCTKADWKGLSPIGTETRSSTMTTGERVPRFDLCQIDAEYNTLPYDILTDAQMVAQNNFDELGNPDESTWARYCLVNPKPAGEFFTIPSGVMKFVDNQQVVTAANGGIGKLIVYANLAVTRFGVPATSMPSMHINPLLSTPHALETCLGTVNSVAFNGYLAGLLLLTAVEIRPKRSAFGVRVYDYTTYHKFVRNQNWSANLQAPVGNFGHNHLFRWQLANGASDGNWIEDTIDGVTNLAVPQVFGKSNYNWTDHRTLWRNP